ncbi:MAG: aminotransferase [Hyphomicrobiales bacterium]|nr:aminotransferase [Hyphomicrobiales bacterium]
MTGSPVWHPFTQHALQPAAIEIARGEGAWLETREGTRLLDMISSWWVVTHGHRHPRIVRAIKDQADRLDQVIFAGFTHAPAEELARRLVARLGPALAHVFYSDSGSTSVEVALKMALGFWKNRGERRTRIVALEHAYHGDTIGTMSTGARGVFNSAYEPMLFDVVRVPFPHEGREDATLDALKAACADGSAAALLVEPLLLGAGGMLTYAPRVLREMREICAASGTLFIADEVMTGFGRTGTFLACDQAGVTPDILCLAKGITGGSLPLAVTLCSAEIFDAHYSTDRSKTFFHSSSYTANPIACAAAVANLDIWDEEPVAARIAEIAREHALFLEGLRMDARFSGIRQCGTIAALDLCVADEGYLAGVGPALYEFFLSRGLLLRPLGNTIYLMPPFCVTKDELGRAYEAIMDAAATFGRGAR